MKKLVFLIACIILLYACKKEGTGGKATVQGVVNHHNLPIPNAVVYIKYGAKEFPGTNLTDYDAKVTAGSVSAEYKFENLKKGDYYLYSIGYDSSISESVTGGVPILVKKKTETVTVDVPVTE